MSEEDAVSVGWNFNPRFAVLGYAFEDAKPYSPIYSMSEKYVAVMPMSKIQPTIVAPV
jgi:hypothetical protein